MNKMMLYAIIRGTIEHKDPGYYFGSTLNLSAFLQEAVDEGFLSKNKLVTKPGESLYLNHIKNKFPESRWYYWK